MNLFGKRKTGGDFSDVDSMDKIKELVKQGVLGPLYLMPLRFNGAESEENRIFAPTFVIELKDRYDDMVEKLVEKGKVDGYSCDLEYKGNSKIPSKLYIKAKKDEKTVFSQTINIW